MRRMPLVLLASLLLTTLVWAQADPTPQLDPQTHEASGLEYHLVPPTGWDGETPVDLLVSLHGSGGKLGDFYRIAKILVPELRRTLQVYIQSPAEVGWPTTACEGIGAIARELREAHPVRRVLLFGFSAGGWVGTEALFQNPDVIQGVLAAGATVARTPPTDAASKARWFYFSVGDADPLWQEMGLEAANPEEITKHFAGSGWDMEHVHVDLVAGEGHTLIRPSLVAGLAWLRERLDAEAPPLTDAEQAAIAAIPAQAEAGELEALRAAVEPLRLRPPARAPLYDQLEPLTKRRDVPLACLATELLAELGDPRAGPFLAKRVDRARRLDDTLYRRTLHALGACPGPDAQTALLRVARKWEDDGAPQLAAVRALARCGDDDAVKPLVDALKKAEKKRRERAELAAALNEALRALTGQELEGYALWRAYRRR